MLRLFLLRTFSRFIGFSSTLTSDSTAAMVCGANPMIFNRNRRFCVVGKSRIAKIVDFTDSELLINFFYVQFFDKKKRKEISCKFFWSLRGPVVYILVITTEVPVSASEDCRTGDDVSAIWRQIFVRVYSFNNFLSVFRLR